MMVATTEWGPTHSAVACGNGALTIRVLHQSWLPPPSHPILTHTWARLRVGSGGSSPVRFENM